MRETLYDAKFSIAFCIPNYSKHPNDASCRPRQNPFSFLINFTFSLHECSTPSSSLSIYINPSLLLVSSTLKPMTIFLLLRTFSRKKNNDTKKVLKTVWRCWLFKLRRPKTWGSIDPPSTRRIIRGCRITRYHTVESYDKDPSFNIQGYYTIIHKSLITTLLHYLHAWTSLF